MGKAKTASKNNPTNRQAAKDIIYGGKKVRPVKFIGQNGTYIAASYDDGSIVYDDSGNPLPWSDVQE